MAKLNVAILFGGRSNEHDVSIQSAKSVILNLNKEKYNLYIIGITRSGEWRLFNGDPQKLENWLENSESIILPPDPSYQGFIKASDFSTKIKIDVAFPIMHGTYAEDGTIQSVLELAGIAYVGSEVLSSATTMDKVFAKEICGYNSIPQGKFISVSQFEWNKNSNEIIDCAEKYLSYPIFVKPANMGSSVGINKAKNRALLVDSINEAFCFDRKVILEEFIDGREIECAVIGNDSPEAALPGEIVSAKEFYDYEAKYDDKFDSAIYIPAALTSEKLEEIRALAIKTYQVLNCKGLARVDFFVTRNGEKVLLNEVNSLPGFTKISMYPKMMINMGYTYSDLIDKLLMLAIENAESKSKIKF